MKRPKLSFDQWMRLIICVAGIVFFAIGLMMIKTGIAAQGVINFQIREILTGKIETGSAGLFIAFLAFSMIVFSFLLGNDARKTKISHKLPSRVPAMVFGTVLAWVITTVLGIGAFTIINENAAWLLGALSFIFFWVAVSFSVVTYEHWHEEVGEERARQKQKLD